MNEPDRMSQLTGELERCFHLLNLDFFNGELPTPVITVVPTARAYMHYVPRDIWDTMNSSKKRINVSSAYLNRPLEQCIAGLLHEMVHMYNDLELIQDTSNNGAYHNRFFARQAVQRGLVVASTKTKGYGLTAPSERLIDWILLHDEVWMIEACYRRIYDACAIPVSR